MWWHGVEIDQEVLLPSGRLQHPDALAWTNMEALIFMPQVYDSSTKPLSDQLDSHMPKNCTLQAIMYELHADWNCTVF